MVTWRHGSGQILKLLEFKHHNRIPRTKISQNTNFRVFIRISRGIIDIFPILGYLVPKLVTWYRSRRSIVENLKIRLHNQIPRARISVNANCRVFIQFSRKFINISPILVYFWAILGYFRSQKWDLKTLNMTIYICLSSDSSVSVQNIFQMHSLAILFYIWCLL